MNKVRISQITPRSFVDGPNERTVAFFQGCNLACRGCQNRHIWPAEGGYEVDVVDLAQTLALLSSRHGNITISGGEPFLQPAALAALLRELRHHDVHEVIVYTGYTWDQLFNVLHPASPWLKSILEMVDILVDGPFIAQQDHDLVQWRGSSNQRPIDVQGTLATGELLVLDWDTPQITIDDNGNLILPAGLYGIFAGMGEAVPTRMCGMTKAVRG